MRKAHNINIDKDSKGNIIMQVYTTSDKPTEFKLAVTATIDLFQGVEFIKTGRR